MNPTRREVLKGALVATALSSTGFVLEGCSVDWITTALTDLPTIVSVAATVATIVTDALGAGTISPAVAGIIKAAAAAVQVALATIQQLVKDYQAQPNASTLEKIKSMLLDVQGNLGQILDAAHVSNVALRTVIVASMGLAITVMTQILSLLPATPAVTVAAAAKAASATAIKPLSSADLKKQVNAFFNANGYSKYAIN